MYIIPIRYNLIQRKLKNVTDTKISCIFVCVKIKECNNIKLNIYGRYRFWR